MNQDKIIAMYAAAKDRGMDCKQATQFLLSEGVDIDTAVDTAWKVDAGRKAPIAGIYTDAEDWNRIYARIDAASTTP